MKNLILWIYLQHIGSLLHITNLSCNMVFCTRQAQEQIGREVYQSAVQISSVLTASNEILEWSRDGVLMFALTWFANIIAVVWHDMGKVWGETLHDFISFSAKMTAVHICHFQGLILAEFLIVNLIYLFANKIPISVALMSLFSKTKLIRNFYLARECSEI